MATPPVVTDSLAPVWAALERVADPEIPVISIVELGLVAGVSLDAGRVCVRLMPTFVGCPALDVIRDGVTAELQTAGFAEARVEYVLDPPWTTDRVTPAGLEKLRAFGLALPGRSCGGGAAGSESTIESNFHRVPCPFCGSRDTRLESIFGPTLCRAIHYCDGCRQSFEQFKPVG